MWERLALDQRHEREDRRHGLAAPHTQDHRAARFLAGAGLAGTLNESHRMMMRSLAYLDGRVRGGKAGTVTVDRAGQVNIASAVETATYRSGQPLLYETTLFYRDHEMSVGCSMPHDIRPTGVGLGVGRITSYQVRGIHNHDMPARSDPIIAFNWRRCKWISVAGIGASVEHVYQANLTLRGIFLAHPGHDPFQRIGIAAPRIVTRRGGIIWHAPEAIVSLSQCLHGAISLWRINCRA